VVEQGKTVRALDLAARRAFPPPPWSGAGALEPLRRRLGAPWLVAFEDGALARLFGEVEGALRFGDDPWQDGLTVMAAARRRYGQDVHFTPRPFARIPVPRYAMLRGALDLLWPPGTAACFYLFEGRVPWTSLILARDASGEVDLLTTHLALAADQGAARAGSVRDRDAILAAVARLTGRPVHLGFFATLDAWERALRDGEGFDAERDRGGLAVDPAPPWLRAALGASQVARTARGAASLFAAVAPRTAAAIAGGLRGLAVAAGASGRGLLDPLRAQLTELLGFDPFSPDSPLGAALAWLRRAAGGARGDG
jgi:hypothetical protein